MGKLSDAEIQNSLTDVPEWSEVSGVIQRTFQFKDFVESMEFVNRVAEIAEQQQHHPDIMIRWNKVTLTLSTHDVGGISEKDFDQAKTVDALLAKI